MTVLRMQLADDTGKWPACGTFRHGVVTSDADEVTCGHCLKRLRGEPMGPHARELVVLRDLASTLERSVRLGGLGGMPSPFQVGMVWAQNRERLLSGETTWEKEIRL